MSRRHHRPPNTFPALVLLLSLSLTAFPHLTNAVAPPAPSHADVRASSATSVELVGDAVSKAVSTISETILNTTTNADPQQPDAATEESAALVRGEGHAALQDARHAAGGVAPEPLAELVPNEATAGDSAAMGATEGAASASGSDAKVPSDGTAPKAAPNASALQPGPGPVPIDCETGRCTELGTGLLAAIEGEACRSVFVNGKCPAACVAGITSVTSDELWPSCATACGNEVVSGAAERWASFCSARQETLIDQGKEAVKSLVGEGLTSGLETKLLVQFFFAVLVLVVAVGYGYRRGAVSAQIAYRLQKRRLLGRKNSDINLPI